MAKHYLYSTWYWLTRQQERHKVDDSWVDFDQFLVDIGERPSTKHRLHKIDPSLGYTKGNVVWREMLKNQDGFTSHSANWQKHNKDKVKEIKLRFKYNITAVDYETLLSKQGGCCAICGVTHNNGKAFAVDHDHSTSKVRGLLCDSCNLGLGKFRDDVTYLKNAITYLQGMQF